MFIFLAVLLLLYLLTPKGTLLHEAIYLPWFWLSVLLSKKHPTRTEIVPYGSHSRQYYLLCLPAEGKVSKQELLVYFHGGSWRWGKPELFKTHAGFFNRMGYAVVLPSYRPCPKYNYRHIREDLELMLKRVGQQAEQQGLPYHRTITGGMSAGGHLATLLALDDTVKRDRKASGRIVGSFALGAPLHLGAMPHSYVIRDLAGPRGAPLFAQASPYTFAKENPALPMLVVHGTHDGMVPYLSTKEFVAQRQELPATPLTFLTIERGTHLSVASWIFRKRKTRTALTKWLAAQSQT